MQFAEAFEMQNLEPVFILEKFKDKKENRPGSLNSGMFSFMGTLWLALAISTSLSGISEIDIREIAWSARVQFEGSSMAHFLCTFTSICLI